MDAHPLGDARKEEVSAVRIDERTRADHVVVVPMDPLRAMLRAAVILSWILVVLMATSGVLAWVSGDLLAAETPWAREAFRGGEMVTLFLAVPLLAGALIAVRRGSIRAEALWIGMLLYAVYNDAYLVFGTTFNDAFLLHIAAFSTSIFALACAMPALDYQGIADGFRSVKAAKGVGIFLVVVGFAQGALWLFILGRNALTGEVLHDIPVSGQHLVFALDLGLLVPALILSGILLARRRPFGYLFGSAMAVMGAVYQVNLMIAGVYQADANVAGVRAFAPESVGLTAAFAVAASLMLFGGRRATRPGAG
jgi:hypothetical protein